MFKEYLLVFWPFIFVVAIIVAINVYRLQKKQGMKENNFESFKEKYPKNVDGSRVSCPSCNGTNIGTERVMQQYFMRRHFCRTCGTELYFSPESK